MAQWHISAPSAQPTPAASQHMLQTRGVVQRKVMFALHLRHRESAVVERSHRCFSFVNQPLELMLEHSCTSDTDTAQLCSVVRLHPVDRR
jgi:hypothetical protein